jgi:hypothetical protein
VIPTKAIVLSCIAVGVSTCVILFFVFLYTPTITVHIVNDTSRELTVSVCGSDPETMNPGQSADVDPNPNDSHAACVVYQGETGVALGCLFIPTTLYHDGSTAKLSRFIRGVPADKCGG